MSTIGDVAQRRKPYQLHLYLPEWMRPALKEAAGRHRGWSVQTFCEAAVEEALLREGFRSPDTPPAPDTERS